LHPEKTRLIEFGAYTRNRIIRTTPVRITKDGRTAPKAEPHNLARPQKPTTI
jgi:hypothetical protein